MFSVCTRKTDVGKLTQMSQQQKSFLDIEDEQLAVGGSRRKSEEVLRGENEFA